jgi:hypothetical protein
VKNGQCGVNIALGPWGPGDERPCTGGVNDSDEAPDGQGRVADGCGATVLPRVGEHPGFTLWRVSLGLVLTMCVLGFARVHGLVAWAVLTVVVAWCVTWAHLWTATAAAVETWLVETGFGVHRDGVLTFARSDLMRLGAVLAVVVTVAVVSRRLARRGPAVSIPVPGPVSRTRERLGGDR